MRVSKLRSQWGTGTPGVLPSAGSQSRTRLSDWTAAASGALTGAALAAAVVFVGVSATVVVVLPGAGAAAPTGVSAVTARQWDLWADP